MQEGNLTTSGKPCSGGISGAVVEGRGANPVAGSAFLLPAAQARILRLRVGAAVRPHPAAHGQQLPPRFHPGHSVSYPPGPQGVGLGL